MGYDTYSINITPPRALPVISIGAMPLQCKSTCDAPFLTFIHIYYTQRSLHLEEPAYRHRSSKPGDGIFSSSAVLDWNNTTGLFDDSIDPENRFTATEDQHIAHSTDRHLHQVPRLSTCHQFDAAP